MRAMQTPRARWKRRARRRIDGLETRRWNGTKPAFAG
jgi:hypothetical protein